MEDTKITIEDFVTERTDRGLYYLVYKEGDIRICLEAGFDRNYDVSIYDDSDYLLAERKNTNLYKPSPDEAKEAGVRLANELLDDYKKNNIIE